MKVLTSIWALFFISQISLAQDQWVNYTNNNNVNDIIETDNGIWLSSYGGLCYVDTNSGQETYYNRGNSVLPSNDVFDLLLHPNNDLWITSSSGICKFTNGQFELGPKNLRGLLNITLDDKIIVCNYDNLYIQTNGMNFDTIPYPEYIAGLGGLEVDQEGNIYVNAINYFSETYVAIYKDNNWDIIYSDFNYESSITMDSNDRLWFANAEGLKYYENQDWIDVSPIDSTNEFITFNLFTDLDDNILIEMNSTCPKLLKWDGLEMTELNFVKEECSDCNFVKPSTKNSDMYFASNNKNGYYPLTSSNIGAFQNHFQSPIHYNNIVTTLHPNDGKHIIVQTDKIQIIDGNDWSEMPLPTQLLKPIRFAHLKSDQLWLSDPQSLWFLENNVWKEMMVPNTIFGDIDFFVIGENEDVWIQSGTTIARLSNNQWTSFTAGDHQITSSIIQDMIVDPNNGDLWVSTFQGVRHYDGTDWYNYDLSPVNHAFSLAISNQGTYVRKAGLHLINNGNIDTIPMPPIGYYGTFESEMLYDLNEERLYMTGRDHLAVYENETWEVYTIENSGIYNGNSNDINIDLDGNIWLAGSGGGLELFNEAGVILSIQENDPLQKKDSFKVYPNLVTNNEVFLESQLGGDFTLSLFNASGKILQSTKIQFSAGLKTLYTLPSIPTGVYFLTIRQKDTMITKKFIKVNP